MATPTIIVPGAGGVETANTLVRAWYASDTNLANPGDFQFVGDTHSSDPDGVYSVSTGLFTVKVAGRYVATLAMILFHTNVDEGRNQPYITATRAAGNLTTFGGRSANDDFWTNDYNYHTVMTIDMAVSDTFGFFITQHGSSAPHTQRGGVNSYCQIAKVG